MTRVRLVLAACVAIAVTGALATGSSAAGKQLKATLSGKAETPQAGDKDATGSAVLTFRASKVCYAIRVKNAGKTFAAAHIHSAPRGKAGGVYIELWTTPKTLPKSGLLSGCSKTIAKAKLAKVLAKPAAYYVNVHTPAFPSGAARGQLTAKS